MAEIKITIHTERLHDDLVWEKVKKLVSRLEARQLRGYWFAINPSFIFYKKNGFDESKWKERLDYLKNHGQIIEQHTHFYRREKGSYDLSWKHVKKRLDEDRFWLENNGHKVKRFISGGWRTSWTLDNILKSEGYVEHWTNHPNTISVKNFLISLVKNNRQNSLIYFHDYELKKSIFWIAINVAIYFIDKKNHPKIIAHPHDHKSLGDWKIIFKFLDNCFKKSPPGSFLDLGAGTGNMCDYFYRINSAVTAIDIKSSYLEIIKNRNNDIKTLLHDINTPLPFPDNSFEVISCIGTLHYYYIKDVKSVIKEMSRVSKKYIIIDLFSKYSLYHLLEKLVHYRYRPRVFFRDEVYKIFQDLNLKVVNFTATKTPIFLRKSLPFSGKAVFFLLNKNEGL